VAAWLARNSIVVVGQHVGRQAFVAKVPGLGAGRAP